jgi:hypothetical protein
MLDFLRTGRYPDDPRILLEEINCDVSGPREVVFIAAVHDNRRYVRACIECAFETWTSRAPQ